MIIRAAAFAALLFAAGTAQAETVTVTLTGVQANQGGTIQAVLATRSEFMRGGTHVASATPSGDQLVLTFENVPEGEYALLVMHDANGNGRLDMGAMGPTEGWTMSNGAPMGMPTFDAQKFTVGTTPVSLTEAMRY